MIYSKKRRRDDRLRATWAGEEKFKGRCAFHGYADFDTWAAHCIECAEDNKQSVAKLRARSLGSLYYKDVCEIHGVHDHSGVSYQCLSCYDARSRPRPPGFDYVANARKRDAPLVDVDRHNKARNPARALARKYFQPCYLEICDVHGEVPHNTNRGTCLTCRDSLGQRRKTAVVDRNPARAAARRAGETVYLEWCDEHGAGDHSVLHGKCLTCFTVAGAKRKWARITPA